jgi:UDP-glucose 4-epimerase
MPAVSGGKFVVVGGASLLGSHIGERMLVGGVRELVLMDNLALGSTDNIKTLLEDERCTFVRGDVLRLNELYDNFEDVDGVFLVAGFLTGPISANPWLGLDVNVRGPQNVLEACRYRGVGKVVFSSTTGVYGGRGEDPNDEDSPLRWQGLPAALALYGTSKIMGEVLGRLYQERYGIDFVALRYSAIYGERQHKRAIDATRMVEARERIRTGQPAVIDGDGSRVQDYVYVGDVARANVMAMESDVTGESINIVSGVDTSRATVIGLVTKACRSDLQPIYTSGEQPSTPAAMPVFGRKKAKQLLGWEPEVSIKEGVGRFVDWLDRDEAESRKN